MVDLSGPYERLCPSLIDVPPYFEKRGRCHGSNQGVGAGGSLPSLREVYLSWHDGLGLHTLRRDLPRGLVTFRIPVEFPGVVLCPFRLSCVGHPCCCLLYHVLVHLGFDVSRPFAGAGLLYVSEIRLRALRLSEKGPLCFVVLTCTSLRKGWLGQSLRAYPAGI